MHGYDKYIVSFSGGKDSTACFLHLLDIGIPKERIELWHQDIDGQGDTFMDWEITPDYCRKFAEAFQVPIYYQWKVGGFEREMMRMHDFTAPTKFETPDGEIIEVGGKGGKRNTRMQFPQVSGDLKVRWCSAYLKIDVYAAAIRNQPRFHNQRILVLSGERAEESTARAGYEVFEIDRADNRDGKRSRRHVDRWRPAKDWPEKDVWQIIEKYNVRAHPAYYLGWGRVSCKFCIFGNADQFRSAHKISPAQGDKLIYLEEIFGKTLKRNTDLKTLINKGREYEMDPRDIAQALDNVYKRDVIMNEPWILPQGAFKKDGGPS